MTVKNLIEVFKKQISKNQEVIDKFKDEFDKDQLKAMVWQDSAFSAVVNNQVFKQYLIGLENHGDVQALIKFALNQVKSKALYAPNSTSIFSNFAERQELCAEALALNILQMK